MLNGYETDFLKRLCVTVVDNNIYVMKEIPFEDASGMETALQEKQLMSRVSHRNICKFVDSFVGPNNPL